jgi:hypothetical protein
MTQLYASHLMRLEIVNGIDLAGKEDPGLPPSAYLKINFPKDNGFPSTLTSDYVSYDKHPSKLYAYSLNDY